MLVTLDIPDDMAKDFFEQVPETSRSNLQVFLDFIANKKLVKKSEQSQELPFRTLNRTQKTVSNDFINELREAEGI